MVIEHCDKLKQNDNIQNNMLIMIFKQFVSIVKLNKIKYI